MWCYIRILYPQKKDPCRITTSDRMFADTLDLEGINFPFRVDD